MVEFSVGDEVKVKDSPYDEINGSTGLVYYVSSVSEGYSVVFKDNPRKYSLMSDWLESTKPKPKLSDLPVGSVIRGKWNDAIWIRTTNNWVYAGNVGLFNEPVMPEHFDSHNEGAWVVEWRPDGKRGLDGI